MATITHCIYCFECLDSSLQSRTPLKLSEVEDLWENYQLSKNPGSAQSTKSERGMVADSVDSETTDADDNEQDEGSEPAPRSGLRNPNLDRLKSRSAVTTPSGSSTASSRSSNVNSSASSQTSFSSLFSRSTSVPEPSYPLFVTWNTVSRRGHKSLRGCIGTFEAQPLSEGLQSYTLISAFSDTRFMPIVLRELPSLSCSLTLLLNFTDCEGPFDWEIGKHGIRISFVWRGSKYGATYLPDVCVEQGWTKEECLGSLMRKAGWTGEGRSGGAEGWTKVDDFKVVKYEGMKASCDYKEWREWRDWVEAEGRMN